MDSITKSHGGKAYEWDGERWLEADEHIFASTAVASVLDRALTREDRISWQRSRARRPGVRVAARFCRGCGEYCTSACRKCKKIILARRKCCEFCGEKVAGDQPCPDCRRAGLTP